jgi:opacity protein-like surface antigen
MLVSHVARAALLCVAVALPLPVLAQDSTSCNCRPERERTPSAFELRSSGSIAFIQSRPLGALEKNIGFGYGVNGAFLFGLDRAGILSLRGDLGFLGYGQESKHVPLSSTIGGRIQVKVSTTNYIVPMSIGPQLTWPTGRVRPYVNAGVGGQLFYTESHVDGVDDDRDFAGTTNQSDFTATWVAGGGLYVPLYEKRTKVLLDLGVQYFNGGHAQYLRPGSIVDLPNAQTQIHPLESATHLVLVRMGVRIGL